MKSHQEKIKKGFDWWAPKYQSTAGDFSPYE